MHKVGGGWFECVTDIAKAGTRYQYLLPSGSLVPDPASRFQPSGIEGESQVVDPKEYKWETAAWRGRPWAEAVVYELHVGTFDQDASYKGVIAHLDHLLKVGITAVELMPIAEYAGARNWGYDGVLPYSPTVNYGSPNQLKRLIDECHKRGLMVLLDVVYNHFGPRGNHLASYASAFFDSKVQTPWGNAINFKRDQVREFFVQNALYWINEYRFDGLRIDAVHAIQKEDRRPFLEELVREVRFSCDPSRHVHLVLENDANEARWLPKAIPGTATFFDAQWNDDAHHAAHTWATGESDGYYVDYSDNPLHYLARALSEGFGYQGDYSRFRGCKRGEVSIDCLSTAFVNFLQNHDQVGNRAHGERIWKLAPTKRTRLLKALFCLTPSIPMLFMGDEWETHQPFLYFTDFDGELAHLVRKGRRAEFAHFKIFSEQEAVPSIPDPNNIDTFLSSRINWLELETSWAQESLRFTRDLCEIRRKWLVPRLPSLRHGERKVLSDAVILNWILSDGSKWTVVTNFASKEIPKTQMDQGHVIYCWPKPTKKYHDKWMPESIAVIFNENTQQ